MQIFIKPFTGGVIVLEVVSSSYTILQIKEMIEERDKIPIEAQHYLLGGKTLENNRTLGDYKIQPEQAIHMVVRQYGGGSIMTTTNDVQVYLITTGGVQVPVKINPSNTVMELKNKLLEAEGIPLEAQRFIYGGKELEDNRLLSQYNVRENSFIHVIYRLLGGGIHQFSKMQKLLVNYNNGGGGTKSTMLVRLNTVREDLKKKKSKIFYVHGIHEEDDQTRYYYNARRCLREDNDKMIDYY